jgi:hypothetical protein
MISRGAIEIQGLTSESGVWLEGAKTRARMSQGADESELLTEEAALRRLQGAVSYKFRTGLDLNKVANGNPCGWSSGCEPTRSWRYSVGLVPQK